MLTQPISWDRIQHFFGCSIIIATDQDTPSARYGQSMVAYQQGARSNGVFRLHVQAPPFQAWLRGFLFNEVSNEV